MFCTVGNHAKHPGLFTPSGRKKPEGGRRICAECQKKKYRTVTGRPRGMAWRGSGRLALPGTRDVCQNLN